MKSTLHLPVPKQESVNLQVNSGEKKEILLLSYFACVMFMKLKLHGNCVATAELIGILLIEMYCEIWTLVTEQIEVKVNAFIEE